MNWRRGLLLAGMNLLAAVPLICLLAAREAQYIKEREQKSAIPAMRPEIVDLPLFPDAGTRVVQAQEEQTVLFDSCNLWPHYPPQVGVLQAGNLPASELSQWRVQCPPRWSVASLVGVQDTLQISQDKFKAMRRVDVALCLMIGVQWFLIGGFPLVQSNRWWGEPGAFITAANFIAACIAIIPAVDGLARLPALISFVGWVWWFGLLLWIPIHRAWQSTVGVLRRLSN